MLYNPKNALHGLLRREANRRKVEIPMKKFFALLLMLAMLLTGAAVAEEGYTWYQYEDGFELMIPSDWDQYEVTEEMLAGGVFDLFASADGAHTVQVAWSALDAEMTAAEVQAELVTEYADAVVLEVNGIEFVGFSDAANDLVCFCALDGAKPGLYMFWFTGASDEAFTDTAVTIATSIRNIE